MIELTKEMRDVAIRFGDQVAANLEYDFAGNRTEVTEKDKKAMKQLVESGYKLGIVAGIEFILSDPNAHLFRDAIIEKTFERGT